MIQPAQLILASSSLPFLGYGAFIIHQGDRVGGAYSIVGGLYTFFAIMLIPYGFPGMFVFPVSMSISSLGGFHSYALTRKKGSLIKGIILILIAAGILLMQVML